MANNKIKIIKIKDLVWIDIVNAGEKEIKYLKQEFNFHPLDLKDCFPPLQRPKLIVQENYIFMILQFPFYNRETKEILPSEIDFFIGKNFIITHHLNELISIKDFFQDLQKNKEAQKKYLSNNPSIILYEILNKLLLYCFPMLNHINLDIDVVEKQIFNGQNKKIVKEILIIRRNIVNFRKTMQPHKSIVRKLIGIAPQFFSISKLNIYFNYLVENTKEIWDHLENYKDSIDALHNTNESLINFKTNEIIKTLTIFSVIVFPLTLLAAIFGMNAINMPFINLPYGFWYIIGIMLVGGILMFWVFKNKKWM
ncbi:MAG: magnesium transporter [Parcubacteria group bacterium Athens0714_12]|nr:MAG: magnesium transporter [Parcubacteria group bacterium Athens0714_12]